ncbi:hypothetical protein JCM11251_000982 [Rhodosporidiobolus azoricus]
MAAPAPSAPVRSEDILSTKTDLCLSNGIVKAGTGLAVGIVASAILFRRRPWPVFLGLGFGIGQGYSDCERVFNPAAVPGFRVAGETKASPFTLQSPFSVVSPNQTSAVPPSPAPVSTPSPSAAASSAASSASAAAKSVSSKVADAVAEAKHKASDVASKAQEKVTEASQAIGAKVEQKQQEAEVKAVDPLKDGKKWV